MIKILNAEQIREADRLTIANEPVLSIDLMERAAKACSNRLLDFAPAGVPFVFFCGKGNNGGDGLAIARMLYKKGKNISVFIIDESGKESPDYIENLILLKKLASDKINVIKKAGDFPEIESKAIVVDTIFGSGLNRPADGLNAEIINLINKNKNIIISIDIPSGLFADKQTENLKNVIHAHYTLTFHAPKQSFFYADYAIATGTWVTLDIGLHKSSVESVSSNLFLLSEDDIRELLHPRATFSHKGIYGHALLLAGSYGKSGAAILAAKACLRSGAGLVTARLPECCVSPVQTAVPEAMVLADDEKQFLSATLKPENYSAIGIGPGIGLAKETANVLKRIIQDFNKPIVIDADALNLLAENPTWLSFLNPGCILTPHPGEFKRLVGNIENPFDRSKAQLDFAKKYNCYVILKGKFTAIACPDGSLIFNPTGNPGMATGGSGDVLTGIITGLLAQGYSPFQSSLIGVYLHGLAGDYAANSLSEYAMIAGDIIEFLPSAFKNFL
jgi:ADP-dependent NAD(P)H-hydrate dehydratase / NAD(P)H-hydrate epimerase